MPCDYRVRTADDNRFWRKTLRDNNANGIYGDNQDGVDPNRNYPAKRGIDEEGASNTLQRRDLPRPVRAVGARATSPSTASSAASSSTANINYHTDGQLLLTPVYYTTDYSPPDSTIFDAMTGTDGDSAVFPYRRSARRTSTSPTATRSTTRYLNYGIIGWTPEMDTCATRRRAVGCNQFASRTTRPRSKAVFNKNLAFALNVANSLHEPRSPEELRQRPEPLPDQADRGHPAQPLRRLLRRRRRSSRRRPQGRSARPTSRVSVVGAATRTVSRSR